MPSSHPATHPARLRVVEDIDIDNVQKLTKQRRSTFACRNRRVAVFGDRTIFCLRAVDFSSEIEHRFFDADSIDFDASIDRGAPKRCRSEYARILVRVSKAVHVHPIHPRHRHFSIWTRSRSTFFRSRARTTVSLSFFLFCSLLFFLFFLFFFLLPSTLSIPQGQD